MKYYLKILSSIITHENVKQSKPGLSKAYIKRALIVIVIVISMVQ